MRRNTREKGLAEGLQLQPGAASGEGGKVLKKEPTRFSGKSGPSRQRMLSKQARSREADGGPQEAGWSPQRMWELLLCAKGSCFSRFTLATGRSWLRRREARDRRARRVLQGWAAE